MIAKVFLLSLSLFLSGNWAVGQDFYDLDRIPTIELTFPEEDWQYPLHYYHGRDKDERHAVSATIDGERLDSVAVKFKGQSSYSRKFAKNPLNIDLNYWKDQKYQGYKNLKLSNGNLDPSWLREVLAYQIARKYMAAPKSNYVKLVVNGQFHGLYGNTEAVTGDFGEKYLNADDDNVRFKGNSPFGRFSGGPSALEYLGDDPTVYHKYYELKSDEPEGWEELVKLIKAIHNRSENIEEILDINNAIWMLAFNNVLLNLDSYSDFRQNFYLIQADNGQFRFVLWDLNLAFDGLGKPTGTIMQPDYDPLKFKDDKRYPLINLVLNNPHYRKMYFAHCRTILEENFSNDWYKTEAELHRTLIDETVKADTNWFFNYDYFRKNLTETVTPEMPAPFPYPGIVELMEARTSFLKKQEGYKATPPLFGEPKADFEEKDSTANVRILLPVSNAETVFLLVRKGRKKSFQKIEMTNSNGDFLAEIPNVKKKLEYYFYAENKEAGVFLPKRAAREFFTIKTSNIKKD